MMVALIWCVVAANCVVKLATRRTLRTWWAALDVYLLAVAVFVLARG